MKIGVAMFPTAYAIRSDELARALEERGFESLWVPEHTHIPTSRRTPFPAGGELPKQYSHTLDPFVALTAAATATTKLKLATGICLIIERDAIVTAKEVASLDLLSGGRFVMGIGGGWNVEEMENHGTSYQTRFKKLREQVLAMKQIWTEDEAEYHGDFVDFDPIWSWPKPQQRPHPPILLGGGSEHTRQRVVDFGDGWLPIGFSVDSILAGVTDLKQRAERAGRDPATLSVSVFGARPDGTAVDAYTEAGLDRVIFMLPSAPAAEVLPRLDAWHKLIASS